MDDDYDISSEGENEFNEATLSNEEYDELYRLLPILKQKLSEYNNEIPEKELKESLYYNYYELDPTIDELKSKFKRSTYLLSFL